MGSQFCSQEDSRGAISTTNDADRGCLLHVETHQICLCYYKSDEDTYLCGCTQNEALGIGNQGSKVCHGTYA